MRFLFVDQITGQSGQTITGLRHFGAGEPLRYAGSTGIQKIAPGIISEAIGQLASWKCINENDFSARPVFLFADKIKVYGDVSPGTMLELDAEIHDVNAETVRFSGRALRNGTVVQAITDCSGYFMPLSELEDPAVTRARYQAMTNGGLTQVETSEQPYNFFDLIQDDFSITDGKSISAKVRLADNEPFYADHFPRMPVTPIVVINELIGATTCILHAGRKVRSLNVRRISGIKIRNFVRPGDELEIKVSLREQADSADAGDHQLMAPGANRLVETVADIFSNGKRILRGNYLYLAEEGL